MLKLLAEMACVVAVVVGLVSAAGVAWAIVAVGVFGVVAVEVRG